MKFEKWLCTDCNLRFIVTDEHHRLDGCPECDNFVDLESYSLRYTNGVKRLEQFNPPRFKHEDEYHSALLSWLVDSDEDYTLVKSGKVLYVVKLEETTYATLKHGV